MRTRRGLSTVVGAVFFVIATTTVITYVTYSMNSIDNFSQSVIVSESENIDRGREGIDISKVTIDGGKFNMTVSNTGSLPVHLTRLWVSNQDLPTPSDTKAELDIRINPGEEQYNIGQSTSISASSSTSYNLKIITERGNAATFQVSPNVSTRIQVIAPGTVAPGEDFTIASLITNNSTVRNNIANLIPLMNSTTNMTVVNGPIPSSITALPQGSTSAFTWTYTAPTTVGIIPFNASYTDAPQGSFFLFNVTNELTEESAAATNSQWSQAASRVGILISGVPNPVQASSSGGYQKWGIGIINPLDRSVDIYAVSVSTPGRNFFGGTLIEGDPTDLKWRLQTTGDPILLWEGGATPLTIPARSVGNFRAQIQGGAAGLGSAPGELFATIQALTSEGKLSVLYPISIKNTFPTINVFYTSNATSPANNWSYLITNVPSGKTPQIFNATVQNSSSYVHESYVKLVILVPSDFTNVASYGSNMGWQPASIVQNVDGSYVISVQTATKPFPSSTNATNSGYLTYQFSATAPTVSTTKLYVLQTTSVYIDWTAASALQTASALSEAGVQVIP